jgi:FkbM family methyltransferase
MLLRACLRKLLPRPSRAIVRAAWGDYFIVDPRRFIGAHLYMRGAHELPVCEVLHRLAGDGECAIDIGANVGVMTSILSRRVGPGGHVLGLEAHPGMVAELRQNLALWSRSNVEVVHAAVSDIAGERLLIEPATFAENEGTARLSSASGANHGNVTHTVRAMLLDELIGERQVGVL